MKRALACIITLFVFLSASSLYAERIHADTGDFFYYARANSQNTASGKVVCLKENAGTPLTGLKKSNFALVYSKEDQVFGSVSSSFSFEVTEIGSGVYTINITPKSIQWPLYREFAFFFKVCRSSDCGTFILNIHSTDNN